MGSSYVSHVTSSGFGDEGTADWSQILRGSGSKAMEGRPMFQTSRHPARCSPDATSTAMLWWWALLALASTARGVTVWIKSDHPRTLSLKDHHLLTTSTIAIFLNTEETGISECWNSQKMLVSRKAMWTNGTQEISFLFSSLLQLPLRLTNICFRTLTSWPHRRSHTSTWPPAVAYSPGGHKFAS